MSLSYPESNELTGQIIAACIEVHRHLGAGLLESAYDDALYLELSDRGFATERERSIPVRYKSHLLTSVYRADMVVQRTVLLEIKSVEKTLPVHKSQVLTYLRMAELHIGLLLNFNVERMVDGITRISL
jgi:GxxExxY protein